MKNIDFSHETKRGRVGYDVSIRITKNGYARFGFSLKVKQLKPFIRFSRVTKNSDTIYFQFLDSKERGAYSITQDRFFTAGITGAELKALQEWKGTYLLQKTERQDIYCISKWTRYDGKILLDTDLSKYDYFCVPKSIESAYEDFKTSYFGFMI